MSEGKDLQEQKEVAYYDNLVSAWFATRLEKDKSLLTLSAGGVGLLVTLLSSGKDLSWLLFLFYLIAISFFMVSIFALLYVFGENSIVVEHAVQEKTKNKDIAKLLDNIAMIFFILGVLFSFAIGILSGVEKIKEVPNMVKNSQNESTPCNESFSGVDALRPAKTSNKSVGKAGASSTDNGKTTQGQADKDSPKK